MAKRKNKIKIDPLGYYNPANVGQPVIIPSNDITMQGISYPVMALSDAGEKVVMQPNQNYKFKGKNVLEIPITQTKDVRFIEGGEVKQLMDFSNLNRMPKSKMGKKIKKAQAGVSTKSFKDPFYEEKMAELNAPVANTVGASAAMAANSLNQYQADPYQDFYAIDAKMNQGVTNNTTTATGKKPKGKNNLSGYLTSGLAAINAFIPAEKQNLQYARPEDTPYYNPYPTGTGSQAIMKEGGYVVSGTGFKFAQAGDTLPKSLYQISTSKTPQALTPEATRQGAMTVDPYTAKLMADQQREMQKRQLFLQANPTFDSTNYVNQQRTTQGTFNKDGDWIPNTNYFKPGRVGMPEQTFADKAVSTIQKKYVGGGKMESAYEVGGELQLYRGDAQPISDNPVHSQMIEFKGPSHNDGGMPINYGGTKVEVEGEETAFKDAEGNLQILGNMKNPVTGRLFKNDGKKIAKQEQKATKQYEKGLSMFSSSDFSDRFERLRLKTGMAKMEGASKKLNELAIARETIAKIQEEKLAMADALGIEPMKLDKMTHGGKLEPGGKMIAQAGLKTYKNIKPYGGDKYSGVKNASKMSQADIQALIELTGYTGPDNTADFQKYIYNHPEFGKYAQETHETLGMPKNPKSPIDGYWGHHWDAISQKIREGKPSATPAAPAEPVVDMTKLKGLPKFKMPPAPVTDYGVPANQPVVAKTQPVSLESDAEPLNPLGIVGEISALTDRVQPVKMQKYNPVLEQDFEMSLEDQRQSIKDAFRPLLLQNRRNPAIASSIAAQMAEQLRGVDAQEFRINQENKAGVYDRNRATMNDAQLRNLQSADQQYVRQEQARSITRLNKFNAANSIGAKYLQKEKDNNELRIYENLYNYRYNPNYRIENQNQAPDFTNTGIVGDGTYAKPAATTIPTQAEAQAVANSNAVLYPLQTSSRRLLANADPKLGISNSILYQPRGLKKKAGGNIVKGLKEYKG